MVTTTTVLRPLYFVLFCFADWNLCCEQLDNDIDLNATRLGDPVGNFPENLRPFATLGNARRKVEENCEEKKI